jgi:hypothetical protein
VIEDGQDPDIMMRQTLAEEAQAENRTFALVDGFLKHVAKLI